MGLRENKKTCVAGVKCISREIVRDDVQVEERLYSLFCHILLLGSLFYSQSSRLMAHHLHRAAFMLRSHCLGRAMTGG